MAMIKKINVGGIEYSLGGSGGGGGAYIVPNDAYELSYYGGIEEIIANYLVSFEIKSAQGTYVSPFYDFQATSGWTFTFIQMDTSNHSMAFCGIYLGYGEIFYIDTTSNMDASGNVLEGWNVMEDGEITDTYTFTYNIERIRLLPKATLS